MPRVVPALCIAAVALACLATVAPADTIMLGTSQQTFGFERVSNNADTDVASLFTVVVRDATLSGTNIVLFRFENAGGSAESPDAVIADIYWGGAASTYFAGADDDVVFLPFVSTDTTPWSSDGTAFSAPATPGHAADVGWSKDVDFSADSDSPVAANGIHGGEHGSFYLELKSGQTYSQVVTAMGDMSLGVALHAQCLDGIDDRSDWFQVHSQPVPEPGTLALLGLGLSGLAVARRRRRR